MVYGILLESVVHHIVEVHGKNVLDEIETYVNYNLSAVNLFDTYDDRLMIAAAEGISQWFISSSEACL